MLDDDIEETRDHFVVVMKLEIISSSRKKGLGKKVKGKKFGGKVGFRIYDVEKIEEYEEDDEKKG